MRQTTATLRLTVQGLQKYTVEVARRVILLDRYATERVQNTMSSSTQESVAWKTFQNDSQVAVLVTKRHYDFEVVSRQSGHVHISKGILNTAVTSLGEGFAWGVASAGWHRAVQQWVPGRGRNGTATLVPKWVTVEGDSAHHFSLWERNENWGSGESYLFTPLVKTILLKTISTVVSTALHRIDIYNPYPLFRSVVRGMIVGVGNTISGKLGNENLASAINSISIGV